MPKSPPEMVWLGHCKVRWTPKKSKERIGSRFSNNIKIPYFSIQYIATPSEHYNRWIGCQFSHSILWRYPVQIICLQNMCKVNPTMWPSSGGTRSPRDRPRMASMHKSLPSRWVLYFGQVKVMQYSSASQFTRRATETEVGEIILSQRVWNNTNPLDKNLEQILPLGKPQKIGEKLRWGGAREGEMN